MQSPTQTVQNSSHHSLASKRFSRGDVGPLSIGALVFGYAVLWMLFRPAEETWGSYIGQMFGAESILLLSIALVLISTLPWVEIWFHGIDRAAIWHRRVAIIGLVLLAPHILLASNPDSSQRGPQLAVIGAVGLIALAIWAVLPRWRMMLPSFVISPILAVRDSWIGNSAARLLGNYERWRSVHRITGLFVAAASVHALLDGSMFDDSPVLRWSFIAIGGIGLTFYVYRELLARHFSPFHDYQVESLKPVGNGIVEVSLAPLGQPLSFDPGQFVLLYVETKDGWEQHPFTVASAPHEPLVRFTVKALGDYTSGIHTNLKPGMPAVISTPHGRFDWRTGTANQVWIAAGVGVAPFLSWLRSLDETLEHAIDFYYTSHGEAPFKEEILDIATRLPSLTVHFVDTRV
ncbi:ferric reductase-like transmembrane domain-containing protein [soil metagenome]